ncbi:MAG TPA: hypothetical protein VGO47_14740 [Chlamydiales bacterium]|jgi:hypothetical protein|nr:hypothetical protein [Chlamydiales bacterium]
MACSEFGNGKFGKNVFLASCPCPSNLPYSSPQFIAGGSIVKQCDAKPYTGEVITSSQNNPNDVFVYPKQTDVTKDYPYSVLGTISRANQKANIFTKTFNPQTRKIIILLIAGFLLFLAATNAE